MRKVTLVILGMTLVSWSGMTFAQPGGTSDGPDVIVGDLQEVTSWGHSSGFNAFSVGTTSCNIGDTNLLWISSTNQHPVIGQNMFRIKNGVMEQVGQSWLKHGFFALSLSLCSGPGGCSPTGGSALGVGCSDPYSAPRNGQQSNLGPKSQVNPSTGFFPYPFSAPSWPAVVGRRVMVPTSFLAATSGSSTQYFVDGQYVTPDDAAAGNHMNNVSVRRINVFGAGTTWNISLMGGEITHRQTSMVERWAELDSSVEIDSIDTADVGGGAGTPGGRIIVASKTDDLGGGMYHYEYAIYNMNSHDSVSSFSIPLPDGIVLTESTLTDQAGEGFFHGSLHHSGSGSTTVPGVDPTYAPFGSQPYTNDAWDMVVSSTDVTWSTTDFGAGPANPIRWGTQYNFRFTAPAPPVPGTATIEAWRSSDEYNVTLPVPDGDFVFVPAPSNVDTAYNVESNEVEVTWFNPIDYASIAIRRDGVVIATLPAASAGQAGSYLDAYSVPGPHTYTVQGTDSAGESSAAIGSTVEIPTIATPNFVFEIDDLTIGFDPMTGLGSGSTTIRAIEDPDNVGYPNTVHAFSMAITYDTSVVTADSITEGSAFDAHDPDFVSAEILEDAGIPTGGITVGVIVAFLLDDFLSLDTEQEVFTLGLSTNPAGIPTDVVTATDVFFENGVHGATPISGVVAVGLDSFDPLYDDALVLLSPGGAEPSFIRGDANGDGVINVADPVYNLAYQFQSGPSVCLKAHDTNDDGAVDVADPVYNLAYQFTMGPDIPAPTPGCGTDPTADPITCDDHPTCP